MGQEHSANQAFLLLNDLQRFYAQFPDDDSGFNRALRESSMQVLVYMVKEPHKYCQLDDLTKRFCAPLGIAFTSATDVQERCTFDEWERRQESASLHVKALMTRTGESQKK